MSIKPLNLWVLWLTPVATVLANDAIFELEIGDRARRDRQVEVSIDTLVDGHTSGALSPQTLVERLADARIVLVPEEHTNQNYHRVQLRVLELFQTGDRPLAIGLEMFPASDQAVLDGWIAGEYTERGFVEHSNWYVRWGYRWDYYRDVFLFARENEIPLIALNAPRSLVATVRAHGIEAARKDEELLADVFIDTDSEDHRKLFAAYFSDDDEIHGHLSDEQFDKLYQAQCTWDAVMAGNAARFLIAHPQHIMVVLAGTGHAAFGLGIARQLPIELRNEAAAVIPVPVNDDAPRQVQASYGDILWGVPPTGPAAFPVLGAVTSRTDDGLRILDVEPGSSAETAELSTGDILLTFNGRGLTEAGALRREIATLQWGDEVTVTVLRDLEQLELKLIFKRSL